jgi:hypothetical protein
MSKERARRQAVLSQANGITNALSEFYKKNYLDTQPFIAPRQVCKTFVPKEKEYLTVADLKRDVFNCCECTIRTILKEAGFYEKNKQKGRKKIKVEKGSIPELIKKMDCKYRVYLRS